jgi:transposase
MRGIVLHLYHTIGLSVDQIAETIDLSIRDVEAIISAANKGVGEK